MISVFTAMVWGAAPFLVWESSDGKYDTLAITMMSIGFLLIINKYRSLPKSAVIVAGPYLLLIFWFLYESRMSSTIILGVVGSIAYLATLGGFLYTGYRSKKSDCSL